MDLNILRFDSLGSTNSEAISEARRGAKEGLCVVAQEQTAGRGRAGRTWLSGKGLGLYFSLLLRPKFEPGHFPLLTLMTAVAVSEALLNACALETDIKWPNDVLVGEKKICGILAETAESDVGTAVIIGIGINLRSAPLPDTLSGIATSVEMETGEVTDPEVLLEKILEAIEERYRKMGSPEGRESVLAEWAERSTFHSGKKVRVTVAGRVIEGTTEGLGEGGSLLVRTEEGIREEISAGDVSSVRA